MPEQLRLAKAWSTRLKHWRLASRLYVKADLLLAEAEQILEQCHNPWPKADLLQAKADRLYTKADRLQTSGDDSWEAAVRKEYGEIRMKWQMHNSLIDCWLDVDGGVTYRDSKKES